MPISRSAFLGILLALVVLLSPQPPASDGSVVGFASAERRAEVGADGSVEEDDEYDDEDYGERGQGDACAHRLCSKPRITPARVRSKHCGGVCLARVYL